MNLDIRKRIFIISGALILFLLVLVLFLVFRPKSTGINGSDNNTETIQGTEQDALPPETIISLPPPPPPQNSEERERLYVVQLAKIFVERYQSYSNQNENSHIGDVEVLVSDRMQTYLETQKEVFNRDYKGISTKVISSSLGTLDEDTASINIGVQQILEEKGKSATTAYKNGRVTLVKVGGSWKVDGLFWDQE